MVADYSSFLEFVGAVYFTMSLSEYLTSKVWSPKDTKKFNRALDGLGMKDDEDFKQAVLAANKKKGEILQAELSKKSLIGLFVIAFLLMFCGYEQEIKEVGDESDVAILQLELAYSCVYFMVSQFLLQWILFDKWKYVVFYIVSIIVFFLFIRWKTWVFNCYELENFLVEYIGLVVCVTVSIPILWQIFITWIHKSVFYGYVKSKIKEAQEVYKDAQESIKNGEYNKLPHRYHEIYMRKSQVSGTPQQALDDSLTEYIGVLYNDIRVIGLKVRLYQLLLSWFKFRGKCIVTWFRNLFRSRGKSVVQPNKLLVPNYADYAEKYHEMKQKKKNLKMTEFCKNENIKYEEFRKYYCKYCQGAKVRGN